MAETNQIRVKCAPGVKASDGTCFSLEQLKLMVQAFNSYLKKTGFTDK